VAGQAQRDAAQAAGQQVHPLLAQPRMGLGDGRQRRRLKDLHPAMAAAERDQVAGRRCGNLGAEQFDQPLPGVRRGRQADIDAAGVQIRILGGNNLAGADHC
jgi:hypothetical protein